MDDQWSLETVLTLVGDDAATKLENVANVGYLQNDIYSHKLRERSRRGLKHKVCRLV